MASLVARTSPDELAQVQAYLKAHENSNPSLRYVYIFWFTMIALGLILGAERFFGVGDRTLPGALWAKWATRTLVFRRKKAQDGGKGVSAPLDPGMRAVRLTQRKALLSINLSRMTVFLFMFALLVCLTLIGADYIDPSRHMFDASAAFPSHSDESRARAYTAGAIQKRGVHWGLGSFPAIGNTLPRMTLPYHNWWTIGNRTADLSNALTPFVVLLAMKQIPFALVSLPVFGGFSLDVLGFLHRWGGRLLWLYATIHTITWSVQLKKDQYNGRSMWHYVFAVPRFRWAWVAYIFLTLSVVLSLNAIRSRYYEFFYVSHIVCVTGFMVATWAHHPPLGWWMCAALVLWGLERFTRALRCVWINYIDKPDAVRQEQLQRKSGKASLLRFGRNKSMGVSADTLGLQSLKAGSSQSLANPSSVDLLPDGKAFPEFARVEDGDLGLRQPYDAHFSGSYTPNSTPGSPPRGASPRPPRGASPRRDVHSSGSYNTWKVTAPSSSQRNSLALPSEVFRPVISRELRQELYPGYAFIQPLAGETLRLVLRTAHALKWYPGQWVYLRVPEMGHFQTHPFTIASWCDPKRKTRRRTHDPEGLRAEEDDDQLLVLLIRARGGFTRRLWNHVSDACAGSDRDELPVEHSALTFPRLGGGKVQARVSGAHMRCTIDGPYGSSARMDWGAYESVCVICGGSGVSFGLTVLEHLCREIARSQAGEEVKAAYGRPFRLRRVRFIWIMREFAHLQWAASTLRFCLELLPPENLRVQIFVTYINERQVAPPNPAANVTTPPLRGQDATPMQETMQQEPSAGLFANDTDIEGLELTVNDLTQFENEETQPLSVVDRFMNARLLKEGKVRRANTRKRTMRDKSGDARQRIAQRAGARRQAAQRKAGAETHADWQAVDEMRPRAADKRTAKQRAETQPGMMQVAMDHDATVSPPSGAQSPETMLSPVATMEGADDYFQPRDGIPMVPLLNRSPPVSQSPDVGWATPPRAETPFQTPGGSNRAEAFTGSDDRDYGAMPLVNLDPLEAQDLEIVSELARAGYPKLDELLHEEVEAAQGQVLAAACGPPALSALVRSIVNKQIDLRKAWRGDKTGFVNIYTESYET